MSKVELLKIFIASPGDTQQQRDEIEKIVAEWNQNNSSSENIILKTVRWENDATPSYHQDMSGQQIVNNQLLLESDILIAIFNMKLGTPVDGYESGTIEEIEVFYEKNKDHTGIFFVPISSIPNNNFEEYSRLMTYKDYITKNRLGLYFDYSLEDIRRYICIEVNKKKKAIETATNINPTYKDTSSLTVTLCIDKEFNLTNFNDLKPILKKYLISSIKNKQPININIESEEIVMLENYICTSETQSNIDQETKEQNEMICRKKIQNISDRNAIISGSITFFLEETCFDSFLGQLNIYTLEKFIQETINYINTFSVSQKTESYDFIFKNDDHFVVRFPNKISTSFNDNQKQYMYMRALDIYDFSNVNKIPIIVALCIHLFKKIHKGKTITQEEKNLGNYMIGLH